jgi:NADH:ubiquinone oxidoreductase subunit 2 (subunit N)
LFGGTLGFASAILYIIIYTICTIYIWAVVIYLFKNTINDMTVYEFLTNMIIFVNVKKTRYIFWLATIWVLFSLSGLPPGPGFLPKLILFYILYSYNNFIFFLLIFIINLISIAYYIRMSRLIIFDSYLSKESFITFCRLPDDIANLIALLFIVNLIVVFLFLELIYFLIILI